VNPLSTHLEIHAVRELVQPGQGEILVTDYRMLVREVGNHAHVMSRLGQTPHDGVEEVEVADSGMGEQTQHLQRTSGLDQLIRLAYGQGQKD